MLRIAEAGKPGAGEGRLRGVTAAALDEATAEDVARQLSRYLAIAGTKHVKPVAAVVVTPFENPKHLEQLRPLENGLADLVATRVLVDSGATVAGGLLLDEFMARDRMPVPRGTFQVLRRENLDQFTAELDLARAAAAAQGAAPNEVASRAGVYVIRGRVDEKDIDGVRQLVLHAALVHGESSRVVDELDLESRPDELDEPLAAAVDRLSASLTKDAGLPLPEPIAEHSQMVPLRNWVVADLARLEGGQAGPICRAETIRRPKAEGLAANGFVADHSDYLLLRFCEFRRDTPAGRQIMRRSIERLETLLQIAPDDPVSVLALGGCYGLPAPETFQPARADELLRRAYAIGQQGKSIATNSWWPITPEGYAQSASLRWHTSALTEKTLDSPNPNDRMRLSGSNSPWTILLSRGNGFASCCSMSSCRCEERPARMAGKRPFWSGPMSWPSTRSSRRVATKACPVREKNRRERRIAASAWR